MRELSQNLRRFVTDTERTVREAKIRRPIYELQRMLQDAPPVISLKQRLREEGFGVIAEIKECSPSQGAMNLENVAAAPAAYRASSIVRGISVLTNRTYFGAGMTLERMREVKLTTGKPVLRKDFIIDAYQVYEARAHGADAILLMANILDTTGMAELFAIATELGMDVLFETHTPEEIADVPDGAQLYGINFRNFDQSKGKYAISRWIGQLTKSKALGGKGKDLSIDFSRLAFADRIPAGALRIAESGVSPSKTAEVRSAGFDAVLVGTALLLGPAAIEDVLGDFERAIKNVEARA